MNIETLNGIRTIKDFFRSKNTKPHQLDVDSGLLSSARSAWSKYELRLKAQHAEENEKGRGAAAARAKNLLSAAEKWIVDFEQEEVVRSWKGSCPMNNKPTQS